MLSAKVVELCGAVAAPLWLVLAGHAKHVATAAVAAAAARRSALLPATITAQEERRRQTLDCCDAVSGGLRHCNTATQQHGDEPFCPLGFHLEFLVRTWFLAARSPGRPVPKILHTAARCTLLLYRWL